MIVSLTNNKGILLEIRLCATVSDWNRDCFSASRILTGVCSMFSYPQTASDTGFSET